MKDGMTSFTFNAPSGTYPELVIIVEGCEEYCIKDFTLGKDKLPSTIYVKKGDQVSQNVPELKITSQPANISVKVGQNARFAVKASGSGLKYQWYYKKSGASSWSVWKDYTTASFTKVSNATWNGMQVYCKITDSTGKKLDSQPAKVTIVPELKITSQPANVSVKTVRNATFSVKASGSGLKYQWYYKKTGASSWTAWSGHTTASFTTVSNATWNGMQVYCKVTDSIGDKLDSKAATITIIPEIIITKQPGNVSVKTGKKVTFSVKATGNGLKYQWYYRKAGAKSWSIWKGHTMSSVTATSNPSWNGMNVFCEIKDASGNIVKSDVSKITIK